MELSKAQQEVVDRYYEATENCKDSRMPVEKLLGMRNKIPKYRPDNSLLKRLEQERIDDMQEVTATRGRPKKFIVNTTVLQFLSPYFDDYKSLSKEYYWIDDIFTGVSRLDLGGNTRDLSKYHLFDILSVCANIDVAFLKDYLNIGERQAQKVLMSLGIVHRMLEKEIVSRNLLCADVEDSSDTYIGDAYSLDIQGEPKSPN